MRLIRFSLIVVVIAFSQNSFFNQALQSFEKYTIVDKEKQELVSELYVFIESHAQNQAQLKKLLSMSLEDLMSLKIKVATGTEQSQHSNIICE